MPRPSLTPDERKARQAARVKAYAQSNPEAIRAYQAEYRRANAEKAKQYNAAYRLANAERLAAQAAEKRERSRDELAAQGRAYYAAHPEKFALHRHARRARVRAVGGVLSANIIDKLMRLQRGRCVNCVGLLRRLGHHLDHIRPIARGGANSDENVQLLCPNCNLRKHSKDPIEWAREQGRLL